MPIIRANPALPLPLTKGIPRLWVSAYDPANTGVQQGNNTSINPWQSKGAVLALNQGTGVNQPTYLTNIINGRPAVRFDGSNDSLISNSASLTVTTSFSMYAVCRLSSASNTNQAILSKGTSSADPDYILMLNNGSVDNKLAFYNGTSFVTTINTISNTADFNVYAMTWNNVSPVMCINGVQSGVSGAMVSPSTVGGNFILGGQGASGTVNFFNGDMLEILIYDNAHDANDVAEITRFFANFYGLNF
jgi:hypothetical protein